MGIRQVRRSGSNTLELQLRLCTGSEYKGKQYAK